MLLPLPSPPPLLLLLLLPGNRRRVGVGPGVVGRGGGEWSSWVKGGGEDPEGERMLW